MTQRESHAATAGAAAPAVGVAPPAPAALTWEDTFHHATPDQQRRLLELARQQGVVYAHQLPAATNGVARLGVLTALLSGQPANLAPLSIPHYEPLDAALDPVQRDAVSRALHTPDLCLIAGLPGAGKSRVVTEILARAAERGERVLLLAPSPAALDRALEPLAAVEAACPLRCIGTDEPSPSLSPTIRAFTLAGRIDDFEQHTLPAARRSAAEARAASEALALSADHWPRLEELARRAEALAGERAALSARMSQLANASEPLPDPSASFQTAVAECRRRIEEAGRLHDERLSAFQLDLQKARAALSECAEQCTALQPIAEARRAGRWWSAAYWQSVFHAGATASFEAAERARAERATEVERLERALADLAAERARAEQEAHAEIEHLTAAERDRARADLADRMAALDRDESQAREATAPLMAPLGCTALAPAALTVAAVASARTAWEQASAAAADRVRLAEQWARDAEASRADLPARLVARANIVAATLGAIAHDPHFADPAQGVFDLLLLEEADQVSESAFSSAARRARRWVLVGEPGCPEPTMPRAAVPARGQRPAPARPALFQRLWRQLHSDPRSLPYCWLMRDNRLVCRLRPPSADPQRWLQVEAVADRPEIELRIVAPPRQPPELIEVAFPANTSAVAAREFIFHELQECAVQATGPGSYWEETADQVVLHLAAAPDADATPVALEPGLTELVSDARLAPNGAVPWRTNRLQFARAAGWDRARAEHWVSDRLGHRDLGRTALLTAPRRMTPDLARAIAAVLQDSPEGIEHWARLGRFPASASPVGFVAVPASSEQNGRPRGDGTRRHAPVASASRTRPHHGGAGFEIDLAEPGRSSFLPADLRAGLPTNGFVNLAEAQAIIRALEELTADASFLATIADWERACTCACPRRHGPAVALIALHPAQAELLARLLQRSTRLAASKLSIEVGPPARFRQRECCVALVSLTRSHTHRAVPFSLERGTVPLALTRAARKVIVFGDLGTLGRRCQWQGALDHLDESAGNRERDLLDRLLAWLPRHEGTGP